MITAGQVKTVGIAGSGTMGSGIALEAARAGMRVTVYDLTQEALDKGRRGIEKTLAQLEEKGRLLPDVKNEVLSRIRFTCYLDDLAADVVIEAVVEKPDVKTALFRRLEEVCSPDAVLATNTSSIPVSRIAASLQNPARFAGMHFFNPVHLMRLVEVISGTATAPETAQFVYALAKRMGKEPVMAKDSPGFIVNRIARHYYLEALRLIEDKTAGVEAIDSLMEGSGFRMGPFRLMDLIGIDSNYLTTVSIYESFGKAHRFRPSPVQQQMVKEGKLGKKSGTGFYAYDTKP